MKKIALLLVIFAGLTGFGQPASAAGLNGAIFTTEVSCDGTNVNIFDDKSDVHLDGGPHHEGSAGLDDGQYYVRVTEPGGDVLGTSVGATIEQPAIVVGGSFVECYNLEDILIKNSDATGGYDDTTNGGGVYKVWVCVENTFDTCKTDNFKVKPASTGSISGTKWNDDNGDGNFEGGEVGIEDWVIELYESDGTTLIDTITTDEDGDYFFEDLDAGDYVVCEVQQEGWARSYPTDSDCQEVTIPEHGQQDKMNINFGNYELGQLIIEKLTIPDTDTDTEFDFTVTGPESFEELFTLKNGESSDAFYLTPGESYVASEDVPAGWVQTSAICDNGDLVTDITPEIGEVITCTFTNTMLGKLIVIKHVINDNDGDKVASDFTMNITAINPSLASFPGAEAPGVEVLVEPGAYSVDETQDNGYEKTLSADCSGIIAAGETKTCTITNNDIPTTRTQGFWSTHTTYTNSIFASGPMQKFVGSAPHKGAITNTTAAGASELYGAFFSSISKKSTGQNRLAIDQARMQLLQQLVSAKLNCAAFGCNAIDTAAVAAADVAFAGSSKSAILASAGILDAYNNSGDDQPFPVGTVVGAATPKTSQAYANKGFWNLP